MNSLHTIPTLSLSSTNIRSLVPKRDLVCSFLDDSDCDILALTETWLNPDITDIEIFPDRNNFHIYRNDRKNKRGGGVLLAVRKTVQSYAINVHSDLEMIWVACVTKFTTLLIGNCYRPPDCSHSFVDDLRSSITQATNLCRTDAIYIFGDFNFPEIDWIQLSSSCRNSTEFINLALDFNLSQIVNQPTRGSNILDLILTTVPETVGTVLNIDGFSDHSLLQVTLNIPLPFSGTDHKNIRDYSKANYSQFNAELEIFYNDTFLPLFDRRSVNDNWVLYRDKLCTLTNQYVPLVKVKNDKTNPWFTKSLRQLRNKKKRLYRTAKRHDTPSAWQTYKNFMKSYCAAVQSAKLKYYSVDLPSLLKSNSKKFWSLVSPQQHGQQISLLDDDHVPLSDSHCTSAFNAFFSSVFTLEDHSDVPYVPELDIAYMEPIEITAEGIALLVNNLKLSTSAGIDDINSKILKNTASVSVNILYHLFRQSLATGQLPSDWKIGKIVPVFKTGNKHLPESYRPISLTCICCKLLEHIIASHVFRHLESNNFFFLNQHGFRKGFSCETQLLELTTELHSNMNSNLQTDCIFLDFSKAFDRVAHCRLISKLSALRLDSLTLSWLRNFLSLRQQFTIINNSPSPLSHVTSGVPQGCVLGPLLFLIYINDLPNNISSCMRIFADDCIIYRPISSPDDHLTLQSDLHRINDWCNKWLMSLNTEKCKIISFTRKQNVCTFHYTINNSALSQASSYKYLGVHFTPNLSWSHHITTISAKASKSLGYLRRNLHSCPAHVRQLAYQTFVRPQLEFAAPIWSPYHNYLINMLEAIQNRAARFISRNHDYHSSITQIKNNLSLQPLSTRRDISLLCLFHKYVYTNRPLPLHLDVPSITSRRLHNHFSFKRLYGATDSFNSSALPRAIRLWNGLPDNIASVSDNNSFRQLLLTLFSQ